MDSYTEAWQDAQDARAQRTRQAKLEQAWYWLASGRIDVAEYRVLVSAIRARRVFHVCEEVE